MWERILTDSEIAGLQAPDSVHWESVVANYVLTHDLAPAAPEATNERSWPALAFWTEAKTKGRSFGENDLFSDFCRRQPPGRRDNRTF
jgi:hypothetical protein